jgi:hypothetical protein
MTFRTRTRTAPSPTTPNPHPTKASSIQNTLQILGRQIKQRAAI